MGSLHSLEQVRMEREQDLGYIKLYRSLKHVSFKRDPYKVALWQHMLLEATYKPHSTILGGKTVELMPGQFISGLRDLEKETGVPFQRVRSALKFFEQEGMIEMDTSNRSGTVFTVRKFSEYQAKNTQKTNTLSTRQINTQDNTLEARDIKAFGESATHQSTQQQHTSATLIQENNNLKPISNSNELDCPADAKKTGAHQVIDHLNKIASRKFKYAKADLKTINARIKEGFSVDEMKLIVEWKAITWKRTRDAQYLRPETLFAAKKINGYLADAEANLGKSCPHQEIITAWEEVFPDRVVSEWDGSREGYLNLQMRWNEGFSILNRDGDLIYTDKESGVVWWKRMFEYIANKTNLPEKSFLSLSWVVQLERFLEIKEGKYHA